MTLKFAQCRDDPRKVDKTLTDVYTVNNASIYQACSIMTPEFVVDYNLSLLTCNYLVAGITGDQHVIARCYFIKDQIVLPGGRLVVRCAIDVLNTWKNSIKECKANIIRQESENHVENPSRFIFDQNMVGVVSTHIDNIPFVGGTPFKSLDVDDYCYVMTVLGGTQHTSP